MDPEPHEQLDSPNGAAAVGVAPRKRPRSARGRLAGVPVEAVVVGGDEAPVAEPALVGAEDPTPEDLARNTDRAADPSAACDLPSLDPPAVAPHAVFAAPAGLPDLRRGVPTPVVPWPLRLQRRLKEATRPGRVEAEHDAAIVRLMGALATGTRVVAGISSKGGTGKTATMLTAGLVLAQAPLARPILVELNPDWGTLDEVLGAGANPRTIQDLLRDYTAVDRTGIGLLQGYVEVSPLSRTSYR